MKWLGRVAFFCVTLVLGVVAFVVVAALAVVVWAAAILCGCLLLLSFFSWIGWEMTHQFASWHAFVLGLEYAGLCALIVFVIRFLPLLVVRAAPRGVVSGP